MPRKYIKKEKKLINYKDDSFNGKTHKQFVLFEDLSKEILEVSASSQRWLANVLTTLSKQDKIKVSKAIIEKRVFRSYHITQDYKKQLHENDRESYPQLCDYERRKFNASLLSRATRISDSMCMGMMAGLQYEPSKKMSLKMLCESPYKEKKKENQNSNKNGQSLSVKKSNLIQKYDDLSYTINPNFLPNYDEEIDKKNLLKNGVIYARYETGIISQLSEEDINHNKFTSMTGLILTDEEAFCLYNFGQWKLSWLTNGEMTQSHNIGISLSSLYKKYAPIYKIPSCILFVRKMSMIEDMVKGYMKGPVLNLPGKGYEMAYLVPITRDGVALLRWIAKHPHFTKSVAAIFLKDKDFEPNIVNDKVFPFKSVVDGTPYSILLDMDIMKCREINRVIEESDYQSVAVVCLEWQKDWLMKVLPDSISYVVLKDAAIETVVRNHIQEKELELEHDTF